MFCLELILNFNNLSCIYGFINLLFLVTESIVFEDCIQLCAIPYLLSKRIWNILVSKEIPYFFFSTIFCLHKKCMFTIITSWRCKSRRTWQQNTKFHKNGSFLFEIDVDNFVILLIATM